jgi:hypothetical protein
MDRAVQSLHGKMATFALLSTLGRLQSWHWRSWLESDDGLTELGDRISELRMEVDRVVRPPGEPLRPSPDLRELDAVAGRLLSTLVEKLASVSPLPARIEAGLKTFVHQTEAIHVRIVER